MADDSRLDLEEHPQGVVIRVRAAPGSRRNGVQGMRQGALRVAVTVAPEKGKANKAIIEVLSDALGVAKSTIELIAGETSPNKRFLIVSNDRDALIRQLRAIASV